MPTKRKKPAQPAKPRWLSIAVIAGVAAAGGASMFGMVLGVRWVDTRATDIASETIPTIDIHFLPVTDASTGSLSTWPPTSEQISIDTTCNDVLEASLKEDQADPLAEISHALIDSGWVGSVPSVRRGRSNTIEVRADWLLPAAVVRSGAFDYLISTDARPLPVHYQQGTTQHIAVVGTPAADDAEALWRVRTGVPQPINEPSLIEGLGVLEVLRTNTGADQIVAIDVSSRPRGPVELVTEYGTRIVWGSPPNTPSPGEVSTEQKLERLAYFAQSHDYGLRIDAGQQRLRVDTQEMLIDPSADGSR
ncbi:MAG: hypothetical protein AAF108_05475 [Planctomycetota bacterium]